MWKQYLVIHIKTYVSTIMYHTYIHTYHVFTHPPCVPAPVPAPVTTACIDNIMQPDECVASVSSAVPSIIVLSYIFVL